MKKFTTFIGLELPPITESTQFAYIIECICKNEALTPLKYGECEPFRFVFDPGKITEIAQRHFKAFSFFWNSNKSLSSGHIFPESGFGKKTASFYISTNIEKINPSEVLSDLLQKISIRLGGIHGYVHYLSESEIRMLSGAGTLIGNPGKPPRLLIPRSTLVRCLPNLYWGNVFGPEYVALFGGSERVRSAPAPIVKELAPDTFYIQLSDNMLDFETRHAEIDAVRERVKEHLGADCFFDYEAKFNKKYRVPDLGWEEPSGPPKTVEEIIQSLKEGKIHVIDTTGGEFRKALER